MNFLHGSRKTFFAAIAIFTAIVCVFVGIMWWCGRSYARVSLSQAYWFLVRECEEATSAAVVANTYLSGGAGYLIEANGEQSVVLACYYSEVSAEAVKRTMESKGVETHVVKYAPDDFELSGKTAALENLIVSNADTADTCAKILYDTANGLERTQISQEEARAAVRGVINSLSGLLEGNTDGAFALWNTVLTGAQRRGKEIASGILFAKDLRYLQVQLCYAVANMGEYF
ncbi:MAG: hypothetical protein K2N22_03090 [Clostridia bacterium]|nr:hypothetical protein [Clostridia bacterium]